MASEEPPRPATEGVPPRARPASLIRPSGLLHPEREPAKTRVGRWFMAGRKLDQPHASRRPQPWYRVLWLTGIDYFSSLAYAPGIALAAAGSLSPHATAAIVLLTLLGALPVYAQIAPRSYAGQGTVALLESAVVGWRGKLLVLVLLGFACTGFILTITISASDAARHAVSNPWLHDALRGRERALTLLLLVPLALAFLGGFRKAVGWAMVVAIPYVALNAVVLARCFAEIAAHPGLLRAWTAQVHAHGDTSAVFVATALVFPKLALGLSGFETSLSVMSELRGGPADEDEVPPRGRIAATRKLLFTAALLMSAALLASSLAAAVLVPEAAYRSGGAAEGRTLAYLAHQLLGPAFGTAYDLSTMLILWFAGASAIVGLLNLVPRYLPRLGMAPHWISYRRPLVFVVVGVSAVVTLLFDADVERQSGVYATGVLGLLLAGAVAVLLTLARQRREAEGGRSRALLALRRAYMTGTAAVFAYALLDTVWDHPVSFLIVLAFPLGILVVGAMSRAWRSTELRVSDLTFTDHESAELWKAMVGKKVNAAPLRTSSRKARREKTEEIKRYYWVSGPIAFIHVNLVDNRSDFLTPLQVSVKKEDENFVVEVHGAVAIANTIAYLSELIDPISLFLGLTQQNLVTQSLKYILWGEGETGLMVYMILLRYWKWTTEEEDVRPNIFLMSA